MTIVEPARVRCTRRAGDREEEERPAWPTLVVPRRGVFCFHIGRRAWFADANTVLLFHPDQTYRVSHPSDAGDECISLRFERSVISDALGFAGESSRAWTPQPNVLRALHAAACATLAAHDPLARQEQALEALALIAGAPPLPSARDAARIDAARERLAVDIAAPASLSDVARDVGLSPFHLARRFRAVTGTSVHQYRLTLRLAIARGMLDDGIGDLTRLAHDLGFASLGHFSAAFRAKYGDSPSAVRVCRNRSGGAIDASRLQR